MAGKPSSLLSLEDVEVHFEESTSIFDLFSENESIKAVDGVSIDLVENDVLAIVGESGCGKTTLGKTAIGLQKPTSGSIKYRGQDIWEAKRSKNTDISFKDIRRSLQIIHQDPDASINPNKRVIETLELPLKKWNPELSKEDRIARISGLLEHVGVSPPSDYLQRFPHQLSGGEKQRVALVRALLMNPDVILADEAISALDVSLRVETMDLFLELQEQIATSYLFITHNLSNAYYFTKKAGGKIAIMYLGKIIEIGPPEQIVTNPGHPYTQALKWATPALGRSTSGDVPLREIDIPDPTNIPTGCRFHTRCPEAREICQIDEPPLYKGVENDTQAACFRLKDEHKYWDSKQL